MHPPYRKITVSDQWGHLAYSIGSDHFKPTDGEKFWVKFPDGHCEELKVSVEHKTQVIPDMGHDYVAKTYVYHFVTEHHGVLVKIPVTLVRVSA